ncbi:hypothetical protein NEMBOFW57_001820 [Staphylotrichum longicolle]|uniref:Rhodopsin domain-containing protein n=1 Tax=Staphylotrichum longicolle TaxID=669026 RepID=A0AAD4HY66_9PEZI|nr:hypothetical protein NEMBOFW57_001820 [Staphylotrichum longicolle]
MFFTLGALVTVTSVLRLYFIIRVWYVKPEDTHYSLGYTLNTIEVNLAIVTATIPTLWPLARLWFPAMFESMGLNRPYLYPDIEVGGGHGSSIGLADIRGQRVLGGTPTRRNGSALNDEDDFEDYHSMIRRGQVYDKHDEEAPLTDHNPGETEAARSDSELRC